MRAFSSIQVLVSILLAASACDSTSPPDPGDPNTDKTQLNVAPFAPTIMAGETIQLHFTASGKDGAPAIPGYVTWESSDPAVASVSAGGLVTGHAFGASRITARWQDVKGLATVTVINTLNLATPCSTEVDKEPVLKGADSISPKFARAKICKVR